MRCASASSASPASSIAAPPSMSSCCASRNVIRGGVAQGEPDAANPADKRVDKWKVFEAAGLDELVEGESRTAFLLRYTLSHPHADPNIVGTTRVDHLEEHIKAITKGPLAADIYAEAKQRLDAAGETSAAIL